MKLKNPFQSVKKQMCASLPKAILLWGMAFVVVLNVSAVQIIRTDFNRERVYFEDYRANEKWVNVSATSSNAEIKAAVSWGKFGTIDVAGTALPSEALVLSIESPEKAKDWSAAITSGLLAAKNTEANLGKLTFSFDNWVSSVRPVLVRIESFDANKVRTGGLEKFVYPATANFFLRSAFELSDMKTFGDGKFNPQDPFVNFSFSIGDAGESKSELRVDNVMYNSPAYYVSPTGKDSNDGRTEKTAFANPQIALDKAKPGDVILMMNGKYTGTKGSGSVASFKHSGFPSAWITLKNYPGHTPTILAHGKTGVNIALGNDSTAKESPLLCYLEVRGLYIRGNADEAGKLFPTELGKSTNNTEVNGISVSGDNGPTRMYHHIRLADNVVEYCGGFGIFTRTVDYLTVENTIMRNNCWTTSDLVSAGLGVMMYADFDKADNVTKILIRNNQAYGNICKARTSKFNGDGLLFDANCEDYIYPDFYLGRTLIQNNLVYGNGGGGIQNWGSHRLDIINNTIYHNGIDIKWGNIGLDFCKDVRLINNIVVALPDCPLDRWFLHQADRKVENVTRINNLYYGGAMPNIPGTGDIVADPMFVNPSLDPSVADFRLKPGSPAINSGVQNFTDMSSVDLDGKTRPEKGMNRGSY